MCADTTNLRITSRRSICFRELDTADSTITESIDNGDGPSFDPGRGNRVYVGRDGLIVPAADKKKKQHRITDKTRTVERRNEKEEKRFRD